MLADYYKQLPRSYLYFGYTTLSDLAVVKREALDTFRRAPLHPDLYDCGPSLPLANGYPMSFAPPALRFQLFPNFLYDPAQSASIPAEYKPQYHTPSAAVAADKRAGAICVKPTSSTASVRTGIFRSSRLAWQQESARPLLKTVW